ncbi:hypothetical protein [Streptomyces flavidovirens]|uniref:Integral membrane protein n=1 Tax=Streptomyces flavidovirens TaxID=67298 RepID=A0ABW6RQM3_9ACTN
MPFVVQALLCDTAAEGVVKVAPVSVVTTSTSGSTVLTAYIVFLSIMSEVFAFTAIGLIARWGEVFPRGVPFLRGRRVPTKAAVIPAAAGATILTLLFTVLFIASEIRGTTIRGDDLPAGSPSQATGWEAAWFYICYAPLILCGPLLAVLTVAYWKRRRVAERMAAAA